jgi:hypothetical protein
MIAVEDLARALVGIGCPEDKSLEMAQQLEKRAHQLSSERNQSYEQSMTHLLTLMRQGWAAKARGL